MKYQPPFLPAMLDAVDGIHNTNASASYVNGDPRTGQEGSIPPAQSFEHPMRELAHLISNAGLTPSHSDLEQVRKAVEEIVKRSLVSIGEGDFDLLQGYDATTKKFWIRSLAEGTNITIDEIEDPVDSGKYRLRISSTAGGGGGGGNPLQSIGAGAQVYKGLTGGYEEIRSIVAGSGITVTQNANDVTIAAPGSAPGWQWGGASYLTAGSFTWTCPAGVTRVRASVVGGGGGGDGSSAASGGGGGGAIGYYTVTPGTDYAITVGAGGSVGNNGGTSSFASFCSGTGGTSGVQAYASNAGGGTGSGGNLINCFGADGIAGGSPGGSRSPGILGRGRGGQGVDGNSSANAGEAGCVVLEW